MSNPEITIVGRIGTEPEYKSFGGNNILKFRIITSDRRKTDDGRWEDVNTSGWNVVGWNKLAESSKNVLEKGQEVIVVGTMKEDSWTDKEGNNRKTTEITASNIAVTMYSVQKAGKRSEPELVGATASGPTWDSAF
jgi:single-strand DNA-binding protein